MKEYKVKGNIGSVHCRNGEISVIINDLRNVEQAPVLLTVIGSIKEYINEIEGTDYEEKYMRKIFTYTSWCDLEKIEVLDENEKIVKTITSNTSKEEYSNWLD